MFSIVQIYNQLFLKINMSNIIIPKIFRTKSQVSRHILKKPNIKENEFITNNYTFKFKHFPSFVTEWVNSVYYYNKDNIKLLASLDMKVYDLIKSYFNLYIIKYNNRLKTKKWRIKTKRSSSNKLIVNKPNIKHTNDKIIITVYTYDNTSISYESIINELVTLDQIREKKIYSAFFTHLKKKYILLERELKNKLKNKYNKEYLREIIINKHKLYTFRNTKNYKSLKYRNVNFIGNRTILFLNFLKKDLKIIFNENLNNYIKKLMQDEITSINYKQCVCFEKYKYEKQYVKLLTVLLENIYNKRVVLDIVNLKYFYNSNSIITDSLLTKLKIKKNKLIQSLELLLSEFNVPSINRKKVYDEMYNKKRFKQKNFFKNLITDNNILDNLQSVNFNDKLETSLSNYSDKHSTISTTNNLIKEIQPDTFNINLHKVINSLKSKFTKGIRIEVAGRLTKRNTADRSVYKLKYKGNIKNEDSSTKNLSTVLLRGHAKSNLVYIRSRSKTRVGAFGLKTWVSSI